MNKILALLKHSKTTQADVILIYADALLNNSQIDWKKFHNQIIKKWSETGLNRIKLAAWKIYDNNDSNPHNKAKSISDYKRKSLN